MKEDIDQVIKTAVMSCCVLVVCCHILIFESFPPSGSHSSLNQSVSEIIFGQQPFQIFFFSTCFPGISWCLLLNKVPSTLTKALPKLRRNSSKTSQYHHHEPRSMWSRMRSTKQQSNQASSIISRSSDWYVACHCTLIPCYSYAKYKGLNEGFPLSVFPVFI